MKQFIFCSFLIFFFTNIDLCAQSSLKANGNYYSGPGSQAIKGKIIDNQSKYAIIGATVIVLNIDPPIGGTTDQEGEFKITGVPLGRQTLKISYLGYAEQTIPNILVTAGKEVNINIQMEEQISQSEEVVIIAEKDKTRPNNDMSTVSTRSFSIDETSRYAGSRNDPARMAMNFAGVSVASDARNDIIIRGNSPLGLLWRLDGVDIPSPNHFGSFGTTGGPVSILNNNVLANSDFMTSAFPAQYGNALSGVFDLQMRKGNKDKHEYMAQFGFNGLEAGIEGPFSKKHKASYLANYRYSTLGIFQALGISFGTSATPEYQDLTFKIDVPTEKHGRFSFFGIGGSSHVNVKGDRVDTNDLYSNPGESSNFKTKMGVLGVSHTYFFNSRTYARIGLAASGTSMTVLQDSMHKDSEGKYSNGIPKYRNQFSTVKYSINYCINKKFNRKNTFTAGAITDLYSFNLVDSIFFRPYNKFITLRNFQGYSFLLQVYTQWQHRFSERTILNAGLHMQHFLYNHTTAIEPRVGFRYILKPRQSINFGYGLHSQLQPFQAYFREDTNASGNYIRTNKNMGFTRSHQFVLGYDQSLGKNFRIKIETYYQYIYNAAVERNPSSFSMLNSGADFEIATKRDMVNNGTGKNYGIEFTLEKFYSDNYYFLLTTSLYQSKYKASDNIWRNTAFNGNYTLNMLGGREFKLKKKNSFLVDLKLTFAGGRRYTPINLEASNYYKTEIRNDNEAYSKQLRNYFRPDIKVTYRMNGLKFSQEISLDVQNVINRKNVYLQKYNTDRQRILIVPQLGLFPVLQYRLTF